MVEFIDIFPEDIESGKWTEILIKEWGAGNWGIPSAIPGIMAENPALEEAVSNAIDSNGTYVADDRATISCGFTALEMAMATSAEFNSRAIDSRIILGLADRPAELFEILKAVLGDDPKKWDPEGLSGLTAQYRALSDDIASRGMHHWVVPKGTSMDPPQEFRQAVSYLTRAVSQKGLAKVFDAMDSGAIKSWDIWHYPVPLDIERLNEGLPETLRWTMDEWRKVSFAAMAVSPQTFYDLAMRMEAVHMLIYASKNGGRLHYTRDDGTDLTFEITGRAVVLDCGKVGNNSLGGTTQLPRTVITNLPAPEAFVCPIEESVNGVVVCNAPFRTTRGMVAAPYRIEIARGVAVAVKVPPHQEESERILKHHAGIADYDGRVLEGDELAAHRLSGMYGERSISGFNPETEKHIKSGRLRPVIGNVLVDEKNGDHDALGFNRIMGGATPQHVGDYAVMHTDFVGSVGGRLERE